jgi:hypothetical protein
MAKGLERTETFAKNLNEQADHLRRLAGQMVAGDDKDSILRRARQLETVLQVKHALPIDRWIMPSIERKRLDPSDGV